MADVESVSVKAAAAYLHRSERSVRRYLKAGRLDYRRVDMPAGGWQYQITTASLERLREELQEGHVGGSAERVDELTALVKDLEAKLDALTQMIEDHTELLQRLLPPARAADRRRRWWRFW